MITPYSSVTPLMYVCTMTGGNELFQTIVFRSCWLQLDAQISSHHKGTWSIGGPLLAVVGYIMVMAHANRLLKPPGNPEQRGSGGKLFRTMRSASAEWGRLCRGEHGKRVVERHFLYLRGCWSQWCCRSSVACWRVPTLCLRACVRACEREGARERKKERKSLGPIRMTARCARGNEGKWRWR